MSTFFRRNENKTRRYTPVKCNERNETYEQMPKKKHTTYLDYDIVNDSTCLNIRIITIISTVWISQTFNIFDHIQCDEKRMKTARHRQQPIRNVSIEAHMLWIWYVFCVRSRFRCMQSQNAKQYSSSLSTWPPTKCESFTVAGLVMCTRNSALQIISIALWKFIKAKKCGEAERDKKIRTFAHSGRRTDTLTRPRKWTRAKRGVGWKTFTRSPFG